ncbi:MAG TPA: hypothetical protein VF855_01220 [Acidimicrobiales bacterium]
MSNVPEGAPMSDDGQYWWDEESGVWISVNVDGGSTGSDGGSGDGPQGSARFAIRDLRIDPVNSPTPSANEELKAGFQICNVGEVEGEADVAIYVDGTDTGATWHSASVPSGQCATPDGDGYVAGIPGQSEGEHKFEAWVFPGEPDYDSTSNTLNVGSPES